LFPFRVSFDPEDLRIEGNPFPSTSRLRRETKCRTEGQGEPLSLNKVRGIGGEVFRMLNHLSQKNICLIKNYGDQIEEDPNIKAQISFLQTL